MWASEYTPVFAPNLFVLCNAPLSGVILFERLGHSLIIKGLKGWTLMGPVQFHYNPGDEKLGTRLNLSPETLVQMNPVLQTQCISCRPTN